MDLNIELLRDKKGKEIKEVVAYFDGIRQSQQDIIICRSLLEAVDDEDLPPSVLGIFLPWSNSVTSIALCITNGPTRSVRKQGIKHFGRVLTDPERWDSVGGTKGLVNLIARISVSEVKAFTRAIGRCNLSQRKVKEREKVIEELLYALLPSHYPKSKIQSHDKRPIQDHYSQIVTACSPLFVDRLLDEKDKSNPLYRQLPASRLIKTHGKLLQSRLIEGLFGGGVVDDHIRQYLMAFAHNQPPRPSQDPKVSESMAFTMKLLQHRLKDIDNDKRWPSTVFEVDLLISLLQRAIKRKLSQTQLHSIIMLGLRILEVKPKLKSSFQSKGFWSKLVTRWVRFPKVFEDTLALALRLGLGGSQRTISQDYFQTSRTVQSKPELRWPLLRLYGLHVPRPGLDLDINNDLQELANQSWSSDIFYELSKDLAVKLLKSLHRANPDYSFLYTKDRASILCNQDVLTHRNFNVALLLTLLQQGSEETQERAESAVSELRKKATIAREQPERAQLAKAAAVYAIASGNLDLYAETIAWQQRYVRDPLTVKIIFGRDAVMTGEGIDLLSGIPYPLPKDITIAEIGSRVDKANKILMTFYETMRISKREPSFQQADWSSVTTLFGAAISQRVTRAKDVHKRLRGPEADVYTSIWAGTLAMLEEVNNHLIINHAAIPIKALFKSLNPSSLAAAAKAMLNAGNKRRKMQDRKSGDDLTEPLTYEVLLHLAKSEKPELAQQLVLQTILDRPDASSWHRQMLSVTFMNSLSAKDAHQMLLAFATAIGEKLEEQSYVKVGEAQPTVSKPPQSLVKVTTVKYLAQLLDNAEFISADAAVEVLVELFKAGTHRDIRLATMDSLLSLLNKLCNGADENWRSNTLVQKILGALETVIPVVGSIDERRPPRAEDWEEARLTKTLPDISDTTAGLPPLLAAILTAPDGQQYPGLKNLQAEFVARFLLPILQLSQVEHRKWIALFLVKHKANFTVDDLPSVPITPRIWDVFVGRYSDLIPQTVLEDFNQFTVMTIAPPVPLNSFRDRLKKDVVICNTPEVQHFISVFGKYVDRYSFKSSPGTSKLVQMVHHSWPRSSVPNGITLNRVSEMIIEHACLFLDQFENYTNNWNNFVEDLQPPTKATHRLESADSIRLMVSTWQKTGRNVLEKVVALILDRKNKNTRENKRLLLPSATKLRLWLLPYPCFPKITEIDQHCQVFAKDLEDLLNTFLQGETNVLQWSRIAEDSFTISELLNTPEERLYLALYVGELKHSTENSDNQKSSAVNLVRVALAMKLIEDGKDGLKKNARGEFSEQGIYLVPRLRHIIEEWQRDSDEGIREKMAEWKKDLWKDLFVRPRVKCVVCDDKTCDVCRDAELMDTDL